MASVAWVRPLPRQRARGHLRRARRNRPIRRNWAKRLQRRILMSLNDPQWGKRGGGNEGPPDLDEMWRRFNQKLNSLFGRRRGGGEDPGETPSVRQLGGGAGLIVLVVLVAWLASGFYIVVEGQRGSCSPSANSPKGPPQDCTCACRNPIRGTRSAILTELAPSKLASATM